jgi:hypothetical protein
VTTVRSLRPEEKKLIRQLLDGNLRAKRLQAALPKSRVREMRDGGMGSLRFVNERDEARCLAKAIAEATTVDKDGVPVSIALNVDEHGDLFELDIWRVDFSPLKAFPRLVAEGAH